MKLIDIIGLFALLLLMSGPAFSAEVDELAAQCADCHGPDGVSAHEDVPTIAGQSASFLKKTLRTYQVWGRPCIKSEYRSGDTSRPRTDMCQIAEGLTREDIEALSQHYSQLPFRPAEQPFDPDLVPVGAALHQEFCDKCHEQGGRKRRTDEFLRQPPGLNRSRRPGAGEYHFSISSTEKVFEP